MTPRRHGRVIVCGSRSWTDEERIWEELSRLPNGTVVVHGAARGADLIAARIAAVQSFRTEAHPAEWDRLGKAAGAIRNQEMLDTGVDLVLAFWDGVSHGTADMIRRAEKARVPVRVVRPAA